MKGGALMSGAMKGGALKGGGLKAGYVEPYVEGLTPLAKKNSKSVRASHCVVLSD